MMTYATAAIVGALIGAVIGGIYQVIKNKQNKQ